MTFRTDYQNHGVYEINDTEDCTLSCCRIEPSATVSFFMLTVRVGARAGTDSALSRPLALCGSS